MAASIGDLSCDYVRGTANEPTERIAQYTVTGQDGTGRQLLGLGDSQFSFDVIKLGTAAELVTFEAALLAKKDGDTLTITDDWDIARTGCCIMGIANIRRTATTDTDNQIFEATIYGTIDP